jgi:hypothetical protein
MPSARLVQPGWGRAVPVAFALAVACGGGRRPAHVAGPAEAPARDAPAQAPPRASVDSAPSNSALAAQGPVAMAPALPAGWVGGHASAEVARSCDVVRATLLDPSAYRDLFVNTRATEPLGTGPQGELLVRMEQGYSFLSGSYVAHVYGLGPRLVVAWAEPLRNVRAGRARFELEDLGDARCRLSAFIAADLGSGVMVRLFREAIQGAMLMTPELVRKRVEGE